MGDDFHDEDIIGEVLGARYNLTGRLGQGSVGQVYLAERLDHQRHEAIKVLKPIVAVDPQFVSRFRREARAINRLQHENIIGVYSFGRLPDGRLYLAMEYADGDRLDHVLSAHGPLSVSRSLRIATQLASAIAHAHAHEVIHRDLKPSNLVLVKTATQRDVVKVLDFGMAKIVAPEATDTAVVTLPNQTFGTPAYMAPEQIEGPGSDPRSDIYSIGCIIYEMLAGHPPFQGKNVQLLMAHKTRMPKLPSKVAKGMTVPAQLDAIVMKCLEKDPEDRYQTADGLVADLKRCPGQRGDAGARRRTNVTLPDDFNEDTDVSKSQSAERGFRHWIETADTQVLSDEDLRASLQEAAVELAEALLDSRAAFPSLTLCIASLHALADDVSSNIHRLNELKNRRASLQKAMRQREGMLRFAISELRFDREQAPANMQAELDIQLRALETRLAGLLQETTDKLEAITEDNVSAVAEAAQLADRTTETHEQLRQLLEPLVLQFENDLSLAPHIDRYQGIARALEQLREHAGDIE